MFCDSSWHQTIFADFEYVPIDLAQLLFRERIKLFDANDRGVADLLCRRDESSRS